MKQSTLALICGFLLLVILAVSWCGRKPQPEYAGLPSLTRPPSPPANATAMPTPSASAPVAQVSATPPLQTPPSEFRKIAGKARPAIILVTVFDQSGRLLRTGTGFF